MFSNIFPITNSNSKCCYILTSITTLQIILKNSNSISAAIYQKFTSMEESLQALVFENCNFPLPNDDESGLIFSDEFINNLYDYSNVGDSVFSDMFSTTLINKDQIQRHDEMLCGNNVEVKCGKRNGKEGGQCKNLIAERKRRKKLNESLYMLRSLVPTISKLDRASILGDAIDFIKELQKHTKELEEQLQQQSDNEYESADFQYHEDFAGSIRKQTEVEVIKRIDETNNNVNLFVKMLNEKKVYGFVKMLEVLDEQYLEVVNVNVTSFGTLVSSVFQIQGKEGSSGIVEADCVKERLLEITKK